MAKRLQPARHLDLEGAYNVRELGGYRTLSGRTTRWKTFLRADSPHELSPASQDALLDYGIRAVIDLRHNGELEEKPNVFSGSSRVAYYHRDVFGGQPLPEDDDIAVDAGPAERTARSYAKALDLFKDRYRDVLATLAEPSARPALFHCAAGQDRTGRVAALLLGIAGVPPDTIAEDYALSARYLTERYLAEFPPAELSAEGLTWQDYQAQSCPPEAMLKVLQYLEERYGGVEAYVRAIGLTQDQVDSLRKALVE